MEEIIMSKIKSSRELYRLLEESESDFENGRTITFDNSMKMLRLKLKK